MWLDTVHGTIDRRLLLNFRIQPEVLQKILPSPFRPKLYASWAIGGICMIRFRNLRPLYVPSFLGLNSENAAHRFAVEWNQDGKLMEGVYIPRRDTNSAFNQRFGGKAFPGLFNHSTFKVVETDTSFSVQIVRGDEEEEAAVRAKLVETLPRTSFFRTSRKRQVSFRSERSVIRRRMSPGIITAWNFVRTTGASFLFK